MASCSRCSWGLGVGVFCFLLDVKVCYVHPAPNGNLIQNAYSGDPKVLGQEFRV